jgi:hypothetical protein
MKSYMAETRSDRPWTSQEDDLFRRMAEANASAEIIAAKLNRSVHALKTRAYAIGLPLRWFRPKFASLKVNPLSFVESAIDSTGA